VAVVQGSHTPMAVLAYDPNGGCSCFYYPAGRDDLGLTEEQRTVLTQVDWLCVTVGPREATREALEQLPDGARLCWVVKDDPRAMPLELAADLAARADLVCCSAAEAAFVAAAFEKAGSPRPGAIVIETRGGAGAQVTA